MAVKKKIDTKKNIINKNGISEPYEKEVFFKVNPDINQVENIKLAQALNQETINNIQSDASPDLIPPDELQLNDSGQPSEELTTTIESTSDEQDSQIISPETFEGIANDGVPQEETLLEDSILVAETNEVANGPVEEVLDGSPALGIDSIDQVTIENNEDNIEIPPQEVETLSVSEENNSAVTDNQIETSINEIQELGPEETILSSNPSEGVSVQTNFVEVIKFIDFGKMLSSL